MNTAYVYLQLYKLFDDVTPLNIDCGMLCGGACCKGDDGGMYLFPGEKKVYDLLTPSWIKISPSDFRYSFAGKRKTVYFATCRGICDRYQRPLACRIFPLTPYLTKSGRLKVITDPRAKSLCPLAKAMKKDDYSRRFLKNVQRCFGLLMKNAEFAEFMKYYSRYLDDYLKFFKEEA